MDPVLSPRNPRLRAARAVRAGRDREHVLLEGPRLVGDALEAGVDLRWVLHDPERDWPEDLLEGIRAAGAELRACPAKVLDADSDLDSPRGLLALARRPRADLGGTVAAAAAHAGLLLVACGIQEPGNTGALVRAAAGLGASGVVVLAGGASPWHPRAVRASAGAVFRVPVSDSVRASALLDALGSAGVEVWAAVAGGEDPRRLRRQGAVALLLGAEGPGLAEELLGACRRRVGLPLRRGVESLNVATAAAVLTWALGGGKEE